MIPGDEEVRQHIRVALVERRGGASSRQLRVRDETTASRGGLSGGDCVVPFAVEVVGLDVDLGHFGVGDLDGFRVVVVVETAMVPGGWWVTVIDSPD